MAKETNKFDELTNVLEVEQKKEEPIKEEPIKEEPKKEEPIKEEPKKEEEPEKDELIEGLGKIGKKEEPKKEEEVKKEEEKTDELTIEEQKKEEPKKGEEKKEELTVDDITTDDVLSVLEVKFDDKLTKDEKLKVVKDKLESFKQKTEVDVSKYDAEAQQLIKFLENKGSVRDFIEPLKAMDDFLLLSQEERLKQVYIKEGVKQDKVDEMLKDTDLAQKELTDYYVNDLGKTKAQAKELVDELVEKETLLDEHHKILDNIYVEGVKELRTAKYNEIVKNYNDKVEKFTVQDKQEAETERKALSELIDKTEEYRGLKIPQATKDYLKSQVESGEFTKFINNPEAILAAYLETKFKTKIDAHHKESLEKENRKGYNAGVVAKTKDLHNIPTKEESLGHQVHKDAKPLSGFLDVLNT